MRGARQQSGAARCWGRSRRRTRSAAHSCFGSLTGAKDLLDVRGSGVGVAPKDSLRGGKGEEGAIRQTRLRLPPGRSGGHPCSIEHRMLQRSSLVERVPPPARPRLLLLERRPSRGGAHEQDGGDHTHGCGIVLTAYCDALLVACFGGRGQGRGAEEKRERACAPTRGQARGRYGAAVGVLLASRGLAQPARTESRPPKTVQRRAASRLPHPPAAIMSSGRWGGDRSARQRRGRCLERRAHSADNPAGPTRLGNAVGRDRGDSKKGRAGQGRGATRSFFRSRLRSAARVSAANSGAAPALLPAPRRVVPEIPCTSQRPAPILDSSSSFAPVYASGTAVPGHPGTPGASEKRPVNLDGSTCPAPSRLARPANAPQRSPSRSR